MTTRFEEFKNRLTKNAKHWGKWARRQGITCYRVYNRDLPQFPFAIDLYHDRAHLQEYDTGWQQTDEEYEAWVLAVAEIVTEVLDVEGEDLAFKRRQRQKGTSQYEKTGLQGQEFVVEEGGHRFEVNLETYLDTGLFLDHRQTRKMVQEMAAGKRFLNLFAYTGSFSVYAAKGGAVESLTLDMSNTYQAWTKRNFELNKLNLDQHHLERVDVLRWLDQASQAPAKFDLIVCDPPSFSNSAKMDGTFDVQRDHAWIVERCMDILSPDGTLIFSNNKQGFKLEDWLSDSCVIKEISQKTVPEDFKSRPSHRCWAITHLK